MSGSGESLVAALEESLRLAWVLDAPLSERLGVIAAAVRKLSPAFDDAVERLIARWRDAGTGEAAPSPGEIMPPFVLPDVSGRLVSLESLLERGPVVVSFNRGHWCPYCRLNARALAEIEEQIAAAGGHAVVIVPEQRKYAMALKSEAEADFPMLMDIDNGYALSLSLVIWVAEEMQQMIRSAGWEIPDYQGNPSWILPIPATFVVASNGRVVARFLDPDYRRRMEIDEILMAVRQAAASPASAMPAED